MKRRAFSLAIAGAALVTATAPAGARQTVAGSAPGTYIGPSSSQSPYVVPTSEGWTTTAILTVGDAVGSGNVTMVGSPDGLGAVGGRMGNQGQFIEPHDFITVYMNHELAAVAGGVRAHGRTGAFVSEWTIELDSLRVTAGADLIRNVYLWNGSAHVLATGGPGAIFSAFCSATLPEPAALAHPWSRVGFTDRLLLNGEEVGSDGRAFAHVVSGAHRGETYQLPHLGRMAFENVVASPWSLERTVVVAMDDSPLGQVYVYVGRKQRTGTPVQRAGLEGGELYGIKVVDGGARYGDGPAPFENNGAISGRFVLERVTDVATGTGANLQDVSRARAITEFARPEDGHWDTKSPGVFYFVTTGFAPPAPLQTQSARLYKLVFDDARNPTSGRIELVVDSASLTGRDGQTARSFDNIAVDGSGRVLVQEDPGDSSYIAKTWRINPARPAEAEQILESDRARFLPGPQFLTQQEESTGVIEITGLVRGARWFRFGHRYYLANVQAHYPLPGSLVEGGQLYLITSRQLKKDDERDD